MILPLVSVARTESTKSFDEIWNSFYQKSHKQKSAIQEKEFNELSLARADRHWLPRVYVTGQWFSTNDPTAVFFNNLGQRSVEQTDFIPADLNRPSRKNFKTGSLGVDLPLFEGGFKAAQSSMYETLVRASELEIRAQRSEEYAELARQYGGLLVLAKNDSLLRELRGGLEKMIYSYQVGAQSNPVGYSGLLGLKGVDNRIHGMLAEYELKITNSRKWISTKIESEDNWVPRTDQGLQDFLTTKLSSTSASSHSTLLLAQEMKLKTLDDMKSMERARFFPRVGLFAQNTLYSGERDTQGAQTVGLYVMWDLFNSDTYGRVGEAGARALAEKSKLLAYKQEEKIMMDQLVESRATLEKTLAILNDSEKLLKEQTSNAMRLFRSGMLNALQLAEVINRRVDLVENKYKAESQYLDVWTRLYQLNN